MANRKPATPTQVRRVLTSLGNGGSVRACAESYRLSEFVIRKIKAGTYHVKPELNKYEERRTGEALKRRRKNTSLPKDYQQKGIAFHDGLRESHKARARALNAAAAVHPYPDAKRLLETNLQGPCDMDPEGTFWVQEALYPSEDFKADISDRYQNQRFAILVKEIHERKAAGDRIEKHEYPDAVWRGFYMVHEKVGLSTAEREMAKFDRGTQTEFAKLRDHYDAQFRFLEAVTPEDEATPRWVDRARRQLACWHLEESTRGTIIRAGAQELWINDRIERETHLPGMSASELMAAIHEDDATEEPRSPEPKEEPLELYDEQGRRVNEDGLLRLVGSDLMEHLIREEMAFEPPAKEYLMQLASGKVCARARRWWAPLHPSMVGDTFDFTKWWLHETREAIRSHQPPGRIPLLTTKRAP